MILNNLNKYFSIKNCTKCFPVIWHRSASQSHINLEENRELKTEMKHRIEKHWRFNLGSSRFDPETAKGKEKFYVLSMFPYPSGNLHMGHVRVYTISDAMARFYRMNGYHVLHPMGWDAFGLPAENAALERNIPADQWTKQNIAHMKEQLHKLGCSFDWNREIATCNPKYYKWTQSLFLKMYKAGLVYQKEALVNWDPVDKTVLADEQVDENLQSWRSGAKIEKKLLKQWYIRTTKFAKPLLDGLTDPSLVDWKDITNLQQHWIGECNGYSFDLELKYSNDTRPGERLQIISVWTEYPENLTQIAFIAITKDHILNITNENNVFVVNPFDGNKQIPIIVTDEVEFPPYRDTYIGCPSINETDRQLAEKFEINFNSVNSAETLNSQRSRVLELAQKLNIGGYLVSSKLKDWLISRQRKWGTPIPIIHCDTCGAIPVEVNNLPVYSVDHTADPNVLKSTCPKCGNKNARREADTMDTFVDSSWYFLRYLDPRNDTEMFNPELAHFGMPVDLYIGGKEHAVLHMYYARFVNHFLHSIGLCPQPEPFKRLLVQGMVMGRSFRVNETGKYLKENEVRVISEKKKQAVEISTGKPVQMQWEKMSKSKHNGVDPTDLINELSCDTVRLILLGDVAPTSHRNWSRNTFPGLLNWQHRLWLTLHDFRKIRAEPLDSAGTLNSEDFKNLETKMWDARNYYIKGTTFNYKFSHQLSVAISKMQGLTSSIRRSPKEFVKFGREYELALGNLLIMMSPMAPHFVSELWSHFVEIPNRLNGNELINWNTDVLEQQWPVVDRDYKLDLQFKVNGMDIDVAKFTRSQLTTVTHDQALEIALQNYDVQKSIGNKSIIRTSYVHYPNCGAIIGIFFERNEKQRNIGQG